MIKRAFLQCGISIHPDGHKNHLINIKEVDNSSLDFNEWRGWSNYHTHEMVSPDFDHMTALISATEKLNTNIKAVTLKQLQKNACDEEFRNQGPSRNC
jgi:hypothetical protein